jgi:hypothetical protein
MNKLTTIASLPSGSGCLSHLPAEVGEEREYASGGPVAEGSTLRVHEGTEAFTPFSTVTPLNGAPIPQSVLVGQTEYEHVCGVYWNDPTTLILYRGQARHSALGKMNYDGLLNGYEKVVTTDEILAQQLAAAGFRLSMWMDISVGIGWEVSL